MPSSRERLLNAAQELCYRQGITTTGVDPVASAAGVTKPTLYAHFGSKSALVAAALQRRFERRTSELEAWVQQIDDARQRPLGVFSWLADFYDHAGERGCGFLNTAAEITDPDDVALAVVRAEKRWLLDFLSGLCTDAHARDPGQLASQLLLLIDGVAGRVIVDGHQAARTAVEDASRAGSTLIAAAVGRPT